jgi:coproporphyrinogen III oxidase
MFSDMSTRMSDKVRDLQDRLCAALEAQDSILFREDLWTRKGGGGGRTRVMENGTTFEKAGVNTSAVEGHLKGDEMLMFKQMLSKQNIELPELDDAHFFATGISVVIHPRNPYAPTTHANYRYFELALPSGNIWWFGGGADLTPIYFFEDDAIQYHRVHKNICDAFDSAYYPEFKACCDTYFYLPHRKETRGIGGIFYDYQRRKDKSHYFDLTEALGQGFIDAYIPLIQKRKEMPYGDNERTWQNIRHGRYAEFNLIYDRGTSFGLKTGGRTESILMSLPPHVEWRYDYHPEKGSKEADLIQILQNSRDWV